MAKIFFPSLISGIGIGLLLGRYIEVKFGEIAPEFYIVGFLLIAIGSIWTRKKKGS